MSQEKLDQILLEIKEVNQKVSDISVQNAVQETHIGHIRSQLKYAWGIISGTILYLVQDFLKGIK